MHPIATGPLVFAPAVSLPPTRQIVIIQSRLRFPEIFLGFQLLGQIFGQIVIAVFGKRTESCVVIKVIGNVPGHVIVQISRKLIGRLIIESGQIRFEPALSLVEG